MMLERTTLIKALCDHDSGLAITPVLDARQISDEGGTGVSVDLRLGPDLIVTRRTTGMMAFDPAEVDTIEARIHEYQEYLRRPLGSAFYLHPGEFALARTLEYVTVPHWLSAEVMGRSSWGRLGLVIATATLIQPNFNGTITLELANLSTVPVVLYVGLRIAQIVFYPLANTAARAKLARYESAA